MHNVHITACLINKILVCHLYIVQETHKTEEKKKPIKYNLRNLLHFKSHVLHIKRRLGWNHFNLHDKIQTHVTK